jgi:hypothetical protein
MLKLAISDFFSNDFPIKIDDIEVNHGKSIPTYNLIKMLEEKYKD